MASPKAASEHAVYTVTIPDTEKMVGDALIASGAGSNVKVTFIGDHSRPLSQTSQPVIANIQDLRFDEKSGRWTAMLTLQSEGVNMTPLHIQGRYEEMTEVPMLSKVVDNGALIEEADISMVAYSVRRLRKDTVLKPEDMVGKTPKRSIGADRPVRMDELTLPVDIKKGSQVTLQYRTNTMLINTQGEAVEPGIIGNRVRVKNITSNTIVSGTLQDGNVVVVSSMPNT